MQRIYYLHDGDNHPIVTIGVFKDEKGIAFARTISIYGEGEDRPINKAQARDIVTGRFENAKEILKRTSYINEIYPRRVEDIFFRLAGGPKNTNKGRDDLFGDPATDGKSVLKIDLNAEPTLFERHLFKMDAE